jgi:hypothetical protein
MEIGEPSSQHDEEAKAKKDQPIGIRGIWQAMNEAYRRKTISLQNRFVAAYGDKYFDTQVSHTGGTDQNTHANRIANERDTKSGPHIG